MKTKQLIAPWPVPIITCGIVCAPSQTLDAATHCWKATRQKMMKNFQNPVIGFSSSINDGVRRKVFISLTFGVYILWLESDIASIFLLSI